jgi:gamma-glutamylcyclotransferase (GGCT)/AIG2-like uncharacterized protein YtfP
MSCVVFVYGTLLRGMGRAAVLDGSTCLGPASITASLHNLGHYPGITDGEGTVVGELYEVSSETLQQLDCIEGYRAGDEESSLFVRCEVSARRLDDGSICTAHAYYYNNDDVDETTCIAHGDYRRFLVERNATQWVIAYGSNLSRQRLKGRVGSLGECKPGHIPHYELVFNKLAQGSSGTYANIRYAPNGQCPAVAWELTPDQILVLDIEYEGVPDHYLRIGLPFQTTDGATMLAHAYIAAPAMLVEGIKPAAHYLEHLRTGYAEHGFDANNLPNGE